MALASRPPRPTRRQWRFGLAGALSVALALAGCGLGGPSTEAGSGTADVAVDGSQAPRPLPDVTDAELFLGAPSSTAGAASGTRTTTTTSAAIRTSSGAIGTGGGANHTPVFGAGSGSVGAAGVVLGSGGEAGELPSFPCKAKGLKQPEVRVIEKGNPDLEERIFGTTPATAVVTDADPCAGQRE